MNNLEVEQGKSKREEILAVIIDYTEQHGYAPSYREIGELVGLKSVCSVENHIARMYKCGMLETDARGSSRAIRVPGYKFVKEGE